VEWNQWCGEWTHGVSHEDMMRLSRDLGDRIQEQSAF